MGAQCIQRLGLILEELEVNFEKLKQHTGNRKSLWTGSKWLMRTPGYSAWGGEGVNGWGDLTAGPDRPKEGVS